MIVKAREAAKQAQVPINTYFIIGQPNESVASIKRTMALAIKLNPELPIFGIMVAYPGTEVSRLAALGQAGYRLVTTDWNEYNKQIGGALEFADLTRQQIEWLQIEAYVKVFLYNYRFVEFMKFAWHYRTGAWNVLKKVLFKTPSVAAKSDYEVLLGGSAPLTMDDIVKARETWQRWQKHELDRTKKHAPEQLRVVHAG
jgi:radical SAM superfamily enzyme YgiQ (UPF0313 family)